MAVEHISCSLVLICRDSVCFSEHGNDNKYEHVASFIYAFHTQHAHLAKIIISKRSLLFL